MEEVTELPARAQVVVVGGGIVGCSVAYHLTLRGVTDVIVLEQGQLTGGTTWHAAGLVSQLKSSHSLTKLATYSARLFEELEDETGQATGYRNAGVDLGRRQPERWEEIMRGVSMAKTVGVDAYEIDLDEAASVGRCMRTDDLVGAVYIPRDGQTSPVDTTMALAKGARDRGATIVEGVAVEKLRAENGRVVGVETEQGYIEAETVVLAAGMWTRQLAATVGVNVPLQACEHFYIVTEPIDGVESGLPTLRDPGNYTYFKEETGKIMAGFFEPRGKVWKLDGIPRDFTFGTLPEDWDHVGPIFERLDPSGPGSGRRRIQLFFNGPRRSLPTGSTTSERRPRSIGCSWQQDSTRSASSRPAALGWVLADWILDGAPPMDLWPVDIRRTFPYPGNAGVSGGPDLGEPRPAVCDALAVPPVRKRSQHHSLAHPRATGRGRSRVGRDRRLGASKLVRARWGEANLRVLIRQAELG